MQLSSNQLHDVAGCGRMWILLCADDISLVCDDMDSLKAAVTGRMATDLGRVHHHGCADLPIHIGAQVDGGNFIHGSSNLIRNVDDLHVTTSSAALTCTSISSDKD